MMADGDRYLRLPQVCDKLRAGRSSIFLWSRQGVMPRQIKLGRTSVWSEKELDEWLKTRPRGAYGEAKS